MAGLVVEDELDWDEVGRAGVGQGPDAGADGLVVADDGHTLGSPTFAEPELQCN